jgi:hypothetical protein
MLIEDVACPVEQLPDMMIDLIAMFKKYGYTDASCFGHALEGNLHLVFSQGFRNDAEVERFTNMFEELCYIVATKHSGSLKGALLRSFPSILFLSLPVVPLNSVHCMKVLQHVAGDMQTQRPVKPNHLLSTWPILGA